ncbi:MAG TPA: AMP-binding protein [Vicinamibacteria bacterium]
MYHHAGVTNLSWLMKELGYESFSDLHRFSVSERERFFRLVLERLGIVFRKEPDSILDVSRGVRDPVWLSGARLNLVESCFRGDPSSIAIVFGREDGEPETTSYEKLARDVRRFASGLKRHGFRVGDALALYLPMTPACVVAYLGCIWAGCRVVSIAESFSAEELRRRMRVGGARGAVTVSSYRRGGRELALYPKVREAFEGLGENPRAIVVDAKKLEGGDLAWEDLLSGDEEREPHVAFPDEITNVLFSSGTTGTPKAIPWTHVTPLKSGMDAHFHQDVHPEDVVSWPTSIGWMMGPWLIYGSLLNRATMALFSGAPTEPAFARFVREVRVSILGVVPSMVRTWRREGAVTEEDFASVRLFSSTGEASTEDDYVWLMGRSGFRAPVIEYLGGTEIGGGHLTSTILDPAAPSTFNTPALGVDFVILDEEGRPVPEGGTGELFLVPPALGLSQRLLNASHDEVYYEGCPRGPNGELLRRHGDRIQRLRGGGYKAQGRADDTMNLGGIKVGSLEIERLVNEHPAVLESAAVGVAPEEGGAEKLVLYVVPRHPVDFNLLKREISETIARRLNPLFRVEEVVVLEALPRTPSNKIVRRELRSLR